MIRAKTCPIASKESPEELRARFWSKVDRSGGPEACWPWTAALGTTGYGCIAINDGAKVRARIASRVAWFLTHGDIADHQFVLHKCDNRRCVNPAHLFLGGNRENMRDCAGKGRVVNQFGRTKLNPEMVRQLRGYIGDGTLSIPEMAALYGVRPQTISAAMRRETWAHVE